MTSTTKELLQAALVLPEDERAELACELLASLDDQDEKAEEAWRAEVVRRAREVSEGRVELVDGEESFRNIRARLRRP
jgi:putative addiction module component (TIGR02574 family)